jgi:putative Mg2+ transporter-C (MgtC) family protein
MVFFKVTGLEMEFLINIALCLLAGFLIGIERRSTGKPAGVSTHCFVIGGAMIFTMISLIIDVNQPARIAAQVVSGVGFLGAGIIITQGEKVMNLTTAASIWLSAGIGMAIGLQLYFFAVLSVLFALIVPKISYYVKTKLEEGGSTEALVSPLHSKFALDLPRKKR